MGENNYKGRDTEELYSDRCQEGHVRVRVRLEGSTCTLENEAKSLSKWIKTLKEIKVELFVLEATGGYERKAVRLLQAAGDLGVVVNPRQVRDFAKSTGRLAKTDGIDAEVLTYYAEAIKPESLPSINEDQEKLQNLVSRYKPRLQCQFGLIREVSKWLVK